MQNKKTKAAAQDHRIAQAIDREKLESLMLACQGTEAQSALSELVQLSKQKRIQEWINNHPQRYFFEVLLQSDKAKLRKNTARLLGNLQQENDLPLLIAALKKEETLFVLPSLILALGRFNDPQISEAILQKQAWLKALPQDDANKKHLQEIDEAAQKALASAEKESNLLFLGLPENYTVEARAPWGCGALLASEAKEHHLPGKLSVDKMQFSAKIYKDLFKLRCMQEALIPLGKAKALPHLPAKTAEIKQWSASLSVPLNAFIQLAQKSFEGKANYRIEMRKIPQTQRGDFARTIAAQIGPALRNTVSNYQMELRIEPSARSCKLYAKCYFPPDERFSYRLGALPASIHPVTAACLMRFAKAHFRPDARVIDPCCGSGTLLIERKKLMDAAYLLGTDKDAKALDIARKNSTAAGETIDYVGAKLERFNPDAPFDELIANLPFGTRVGTQKELDSLYEALFFRLKVLLKPGGKALLYTTHRRKIHQLTAQHHFDLLDEMPFDSGGLRPWAMIIQI